ncbi:hypothetical protein EVG20_g9393, partial [Dentipellis fragilis]
VSADLNNLPPSPISPSGDGRKKSNPLIDLIETEKIYVDQLTGIIRKVAAAWSRSNLPPPELDLMFRSLEGVFKANRSLLSRLKEIGTNPSSPKALGDLLMRWIDDLEGPYTLYCDRYCSGFDDWEPVRSNERLPTVLASFSVATPPPLPADGPEHPPEPPIWTLDQLFLLPRARIRYYKKLYARLMKGTQPGRSDYKLLLGAAEKLERLLATIDSRSSIRAGGSLPRAPPETEDEVVIDFRAQINNLKAQLTSADSFPPASSESSSARGSALSSAPRFSQETGSTSIDRISNGSLSIPLPELERRLAVDQCLDIFTMRPKQVRLQILPPSLPFARETRIATDVFIRLTPKSTGVEVTHSRGRVFILSDLFLACERMGPGESSPSVPEADMWLLYPPLAGKHLKVAPLDGQDNAVQVTIMRKEKLTLEFESVRMRDRVLAEFRECIEFATAITPSSKHPVPPLPPMKGLPKSSSTPLPPGPANMAPSSSAPDLQSPSPSNSSRSPPPKRSSSPMNSSPAFSPAQRALSPPSDPPSRSGSGTPLTPQSLAEGMSRLVLSPDAQVQQVSQRVPSLHDPLPGPTYPTRSSSQAQQMSSLDVPPGPMSFGPGQVIPPQRVASAGPLGRPGPGPPRPGGPPYGPGPQGMGGPPMGGMGPNMGGMGQPYPNSNPMAPPSAPYVSASGRAPSDPSFQGGLRKSNSSHSLASQYSQGRVTSGGPGIPPMPGMPPRNNSYSSLQAPQPRPILPSVQLSSRSLSMATGSIEEPSPPNSPIEETPVPTGPVTSTISAQMKCKVFLKQHHAQWKSLGSAKLKLYREQPTNVKQLVVEADDRNHSPLISTIVLTDGVERVGKTGVAIELSDKGARTGIVYMIQLRNEQSAQGFFDSLLAGSDRSR